MKKSNHSQSTFVRKLVGASILFLIFAGAANALVRHDTVPLTIRSDPGGKMISYAANAKKLERVGREVKFAGSCDSACTLYTTLPKSQTCITKSASFGFHLPYGSSPQNNRIAANYMMGKYPGWVRSWLNAKGGLTSQMKRMGYDYASKYMRTCTSSITQSFAFSASSGKVSVFNR